MAEGLWILFMCVLGLLAGSLLNWVIGYLPVMLQRRALGQSLPLSWLPARFTLSLPCSVCVVCQRKIGFYHSLLLLSRLVIRGRCRYCGQRIGLRYPLVELAAVLGSCWVALYCSPGIIALALALCVWLLIALIAIDIEHMLLPDRLTLPLLWLGLLANLNNALVPLSDAVLGVVMGYLCLWILYWGFRLATGKEGLGYGDFKLLAALGAWCGWQRLSTILLGAALAGMLAIVLLRLAGRAGRGEPLPFGPCLALSGWWEIVTLMGT